MAKAHVECVQGLVETNPAKGAMPRPLCQYSEKYSVGFEKPMSMQTFLRLSKSSFVRQYGNLAYICNQLTKHDRVYDAAGGAFLRAIRRESRTLDDAIEEIAQQFDGCDMVEVRSDFVEFLTSLESDLFVVVAETSEALDQKEPRFQYGSDMVNYKEVTRSFWNPDAEPWLRSSQTVLQEHFSVSPTLVDFQIELTSKCNERCRHCYLPPSRDKTTLSPDVVSRVLGEFADMGGITITFSGGEPLLHPELSVFLQQARKRDLSITLLSNATLLTDSILKHIVKANISLFQVSIYSLVPEEHDHITGIAGSHSLSMAAIEKLMVANVPVQISCPVMMTNYNSYADVLRWANGLGMKAYTDYILVARSDQTTDNLEERLQKEHLQCLITDIVNHDMEYQEETNEAARKASRRLAPSRNPEGQVCGVGRSTLCLSATGNYYPCSSWRGLLVGDAHKDSLESVWENSQGLARLRRIAWSCFPDCLSCADFDFCAMCMARNFNEGNGDMFKINEHYCMVARLNKSIVDEYHAKKRPPQKTANRVAGGV